MWFNPNKNAGHTLLISLILYISKKYRFLAKYDLFNIKCRRKSNAYLIISNSL